MVKLLSTMAISAVMLVVMVPSGHGQQDWLDKAKNSLSNVGTWAQDTFGGLGQSIKCMGNTAQDESLKKCQNEATENWKAEPEPKKQLCCRGLAVKQCWLDLAKDKCSEGETKQVDDWLNDQIKSQCSAFIEEPLKCGTFALVPIISFVVISALAVIQFS